MEVIRIELKQHTPLIHFQPNEPGATLRASEVKPRLDKFIIAKVGGGDYEVGKNKIRKDHKEWLIPKDDVYALNYKMRIEAENVTVHNIEGYFGYNKKDKPLPSPMFFGNMQNEENGDTFIKKQFSLCEKLNLIIISDPTYKIPKCPAHITPPSNPTDNNSLDEFIRKHIEEFFLCSNFGTRQSKGYGSFTVTSIDGEEVENQQNKKLPYPYFKVKGNVTKLFQEMELFYKAIRSGINQCWGQEFYLKSLMFAYAKREGLQWEKKTIKSVIYKDIINKKELENHPDSDLLIYTSNPSEGFFLFKDCLGLSCTESWLKPFVDRSELKYDKRHKITISKRSNDPETIQRMKSPITLKPVEQNDDSFRVYVIYQETDKNLLGKKFYISTTNNKELALTVFPKFKVKEYMDFIVNCDIKKLILKGNGTTTAKTIIRIFKELKESYK